MRTHTIRHKYNQKIRKCLWYFVQTYEETNTSNYAIIKNKMG